MAEKSAKKKPKKAAKADPSVLGSLRSTRPTRLGGDRRGAARPARTTSTATATAGKASAPAVTKAEPAATTTPATATSGAAATKPRAAKASGAAAQKSAAATKAKAAKSSGAATTKRKASAAAPKKPKVRPEPTPAAAPPAGWQVPSGDDGRRDGGPTELVTTAVQAAGELAQIGITVGGQLLKRAAGRLPRP